MSILGENIVPFKLRKEFLAQYEGKQPAFGPLGYFTFKRTYARELFDGTTEEFWQMDQRVVEGAFTILKWHYDQVGLVWVEDEWMHEAEEMFRRIWEFKFLPAGRGMWLMGTDFMYEHGSAGLCSCAFVSTKNIAVELAEPFCWAMEASTLGIGCGFDVDGSKENLIIKKPDSVGHVVHVVKDSREGWVDSLRVLLNAYLTGSYLPRYDYSQVRPKGTPLKSFGGRASGPGPLITMHEDLIKLLDASIGMPLDSEHIADIFNMIGRCIVSGNIRRSAQIALGDPDDDKFMRLKEDKEKSIAYRWASNNTIKVPIQDEDNRELYKKIVDLNIAGTDVGLVFMDVIRSKGRLIDGPDYSDRYADGINPCQPTDALVFDDDRMRYITDQDATTWTSWKTGEKEVLALTTNTGLTIRCTPDHRIMLKDGSWCEAKDLLNKELKQPADWLHWRQKTMTGRAVEKSTNAIANFVEMNDDVLRGFLFGDGFVCGKRQGVAVKLNRDKEPEVAAMLESSGFHWQQSGSYYINREDIVVDVSFLDKRVFDRELPKDIINGTFDKVANFFRGLFEANGSCNKNGQISLKLTNEATARNIQVLLGALGIHASLVSNPEATIEWHNGTYTSKESFNLQIPGSYANQFMQIGFMSKAKNSNLRFDIANHVKIFVRDIKSLGVMEVWDYRMNEGPNYTYCQGNILHNCGEQALESYEVCNLVETYPYKHEDMKDYKKTLRYAYLYGKIVTLLPTHWKRTNAVMRKNRRIGISQSGIVEAMNGIFSEDLSGKLDNAYLFIKEADEKYSHKLLVNRSIRLTTVKPSGTNSLLAGCSPGIHYPHSEYYVRRVRVSDNSHLLPPVVAAGFPVEPDVYSPNTMVVSFPVHSPNFTKCKDDITIDEQLSHVRTYQQYWSDNQVSVTISIKPEDRDALVELLMAYEGRIKSLSFLVEGDVYAQAPLEAITEEQYLALTQDLKPLDLSSVKIGGGGVIFCTNDKCELKL